MNAKKKIAVYGLGNAIVDLQLALSEEEFASFELEKSSMNLVDLPQQLSILDKLSTHDVHRASGGSAANTIITLAQLGTSTALASLVGDDNFGLFYHREMSSLGVTFHNPPVSQAATGTCVILITPDAERTMNTHLGIGAELSQLHIDEELIKQSEWLYIEGYLFASPPAQEAIRRAVKLAKAHGTKIALTCSDAFIVQTFRQVLDEILRETDLVFANYREAAAYSGKSSDRESFLALQEVVPEVVLTLSERGALVSSNNEISHIPARQIRPLDATGAGDAFAAGYLFGRHNGLDSRQAGNIACFLASKVVSQLGPRLSGDLPGLLREEGLIA